MRTNKNGDPAIPKLVWETKASAHRKFAKELFEILRSDAAKSKAGLHDALNAKITEHTRLALVCNELKAETKKGRPPKPTPKETSKNMLAVLLAEHGKKRRSGRPSENAARFYRATFNFVEFRRARLAAENGGNPTLKAAIDSINSEMARKLGKRESTYVTTNYNSIRSAYGRGRKLSEA